MLTFNKSNKGCLSENSQRMALYLSICSLFISTAVLIRTELVHHQECSGKVSNDEFENLKRIVVSLNENGKFSPGRESRGEVISTILVFSFKTSRHNSLCQVSMHLNAFWLEVTSIRTLLYSPIGLQFNI